MDHTDQRERKLHIASVSDDPVDFFLLKWRQSSYIYDLMKTDNSQPQANKNPQTDVSPTTLTTIYGMWM